MQKSNEAAGNYAIACARAKETNVLAKDVPLLLVPYVIKPNSNKPSSEDRWANFICFCGNG